MSAEVRISRIIYQLESNVSYFNVVFYLFFSFSVVKRSVDTEITAYTEFSGSVIKYRIDNMHEAVAAERK